ncbi:hypothetical protein BDR07DRAFT_1408645 [Suillus spraguei]|nr:hypothetical protein BDR07DRAFT_1408645 [Suillus spraguei]
MHFIFYEHKIRFHFYTGTYIFLHSYAPMLTHKIHCGVPLSRLPIRVGSGPSLRISTLDLTHGPQ